MADTKKGIFSILSTMFFVVGVIVSIVLPIVFYKSFNRIVKSEPLSATSDNSEIMQYIDKCIIKGKRIDVQGWMTPKDGYGEILVFALIDGEYISLRTKSIVIPEVSKEFSKPGLYDRSGFTASAKYRTKIKNAEILFQVKRGSKIYVVKHDCK